MCFSRHVQTDRQTRLSQYFAVLLAAEYCDELITRIRQTNRLTYWIYVVVMKYHVVMTLGELETARLMSSRHDIS